jgi:hypothetical protein
MLKRYVFVFLSLGMTGLCHAQSDMPKEVSRIVDNYLKDSTAHFGPLSAQKSGYFSRDSVQIKDLRVERVLRHYKIKHIFLDAYPDTVPLSEIIEPSGIWTILITAHNKPLYEISLDETKEKPTLISMGGPVGGSYFGDMWEALIKTYPKSTGINPVFFSQSGWIFFGPEERFLYFKQKGPRKIYYIKTGRGGELSELLPGSMEELDDSKVLMEYWKKQGLNEVGLSPEEFKRRRERK